MDLTDKIIGAESGGDPNAKNPMSSASGPSQFIDSTWLSTLRSSRPDIAQGQSDSDLLALKTDPQLSREMTAAYAAQNGGILKQAGLPVTPGTTYLAHFAGPQGAVGLLNADPSAPASSVLTAGAMKANPFLANMSAGDVAAWADRKMGGKGVAPMSLGGPQPAQAAPLSLAPPAKAPAFSYSGAPSAAPAAAAPTAPAAAPAPGSQMFNILPQRKFYQQPAPFSFRGIA